MSRILVFNIGLDSGGAEKQLYYLTRFLKNQNHIVDFLVYNRKGHYLDKLLNLSVNVFDFKKQSIWRDSRRLRNIIRKNRYDIVVSFLPRCNLISELASFPWKKWKIVVGARSANPAFVKCFRYRFYYWAHIVADIVISNSSVNKKDILKVNKFLKPSKIHVIYNIVEANVKESIYIPLNKEKVNLIIAANYRDVKNVDGLIKALALLSDDEQRLIKVDWYGLDLGALTKSKEQIINQGLSSVISLNDSTDIILDKFFQSDIVGLFSHYEGLPNCLCEALIIGKPVVCTPVSDMPYLLKDTNNFICKSDSSYDISLALSNVVQRRNYLVEIGKENRLFFNNMFSEASISKKYEELFA